MRFIFLLYALVLLYSCSSPKRQPPEDFSFPTVEEPAVDTSSSQPVLTVSKPAETEPAPEPVYDDDTANYSIRVVSDVNSNTNSDYSEVFVQPSVKFTIDIYSSKHIIDKLHKYFVASKIYEEDNTLMKSVVEKLWWHYYLRGAMTNNNQLDPKAAEIAAQTLVDFPLNVWAEYKTLVHNRKLEEDKRIADAIVSEWAVTKVVDRGNKSITYRIVKRNGR